MPAFTDAAAGAALCPWFALTVRPKHERTTARYLRGLGFDEYVPLHRVRRYWSDRVKEMEAVLFPGYIFCRFSYDDRLRVLGAPGVNSMVTAGRTPLQVDESEIAAVRRLIASGRPLDPWPYIRIGQHVAIEHGALAGVRGVVLREKDRWRVVVSVEALDRSISIEVDREMVCPTKPPARSSPWPYSNLEIAS